MFSCANSYAKPIKVYVASDGKYLLVDNESVTCENAYQTLIWMHTLRKLAFHFLLN